MLNLESSFNINLPIHFLLFFICCSYPQFLAIKSVCLKPGWEIYNVDLLILNLFDMTVFCGWLSYWMVVNSWLISGFLMSMLRKSCHSTCLGSWSHIKQSCSSFWLGLKYTKQKPPSLLCEFLCPRATDFLPNNYYVPSLILLERFILIWIMESEEFYWRECLESSLEDTTVFSRLSGDRVLGIAIYPERILKCLLPISVSLYWKEF